MIRRANDKSILLFLPERLSALVLSAIQLPILFWSAFSMLKPTLGRFHNQDRYSFVQIPGRGGLMATKHQSWALHHELKQWIASLLVHRGLQKCSSFKWHHKPKWSLAHIIWESSFWSLPPTSTLYRYLDRSPCRKWTGTPSACSYGSPRRWCRRCSSSLAMITCSANSLVAWRSCYRLHPFHLLLGSRSQIRCSFLSRWSIPLSSNLAKYWSGYLPCLSFRMESAVAYLGWSLLHFWWEHFWYSPSAKPHHTDMDSLRRVLAHILHRQFCWQFPRPR